MITNIIMVITIRITITNAITITITIRLQNPGRATLTANVSAKI